MKKVLSLLTIITAVICTTFACAAAEPIPKLTAETVSSTRIKLGWTKSEVTAYEVYMKKTENSRPTIEPNVGPVAKYFGYRKLATVKGLSYTVKNLDTASKYKFYVVPLTVKDGKTIQGAKSAAVYGVTGGYFIKTVTLRYNDGTESLVFAYTYDSKGNTLSAVAAPFTTASNGGKKEYAYDKNGNMIAKTSIYAKVGESYVTKRKYKYDADGNVISEWSGDGDLLVTYTYDSMGKILTAKYEKYTIIYSYDENGRLSSNTTSWGGTMEYKYDEYVNLLPMSAPSSDGGIPGYDDVVYTYDSDGYLLKEAGYNNSYRKYTYDKNGNRLSYEIKNEAGDVFKYVYAYDSKGNLLTCEEGDEFTAYTYVSGRDYDYGDIPPEIDYRDTSVPECEKKLIIRGEK